MNLLPWPKKLLVPFKTLRPLSLEHSMRFLLLTRQYVPSYSVLYHHSQDWALILTELDSLILKTLWCRNRAWLRVSVIGTFYQAS